MHNHPFELIPVCGDHSYKALNRLLLEQALACPECGAHQAMLMILSENRIKPRYLVTCMECTYQGPFAKNIPAAVTRWNKPLGFFAALKRRWNKCRMRKRQRLPGQSASYSFSQ